MRLDPNQPPDQAMSACPTTTAHNNVCVPLLVHGKPECCLIANAEPPEDNNNNSQDCGQEAEFLRGGTSNRPKNYLISGILGSRREDWFASRAKPACRRRRRRRRGDLCRWPHAMQSSFVIYNRISFRSTVLGPGGVLKRVRASSQSEQSMVDPIMGSMVFWFLGLEVDGWWQRRNNWRKHRINKNKPRRNGTGLCKITTHTAENTTF